MTPKRLFGVPSMRMYPYTSPVRTGAQRADEQIDIGEYIGYQSTEQNPVVSIYVDYDFVSPSGGPPVLYEPMSVQTAEHWVFLGDKPYDAARPFSVKRIGPASGLVHASLTDFLKDMAGRTVARYVIARAVTLPPPTPGEPPAIPADGRAILGEGGYRVYQRGREVGAILVTPQAEHWGVSQAYDIEIGFDLEATGELSGYDAWAAYINAHFEPCIHWLVTGETGELAR